MQGQVRPHDDNPVAIDISEALKDSGE